MKLNPLPAAAAGLARSAASISFGGDDFAAKLTIGQIIKGRVLRSYDGGRHLVDFGGRQKVVDSAVPLRPDEVFHGRVVGLGERVELQRLHADVGAPVTPEAPGRGEALPPGQDPAQVVAELVARLQGKLPPADLAALQRAVTQAAEPGQMARAALALARAGVPLSAGALRAVGDALAADRDGAMFVLPDTAIHLATQPVSADAVTASPAAPLASLLAGLLGGEAIGASVKDGNVNDGNVNDDDVERTGPGGADGAHVDPANSGAAGADGGAAGVDGSGTFARDPAGSFAGNGGAERRDPRERRADPDLARLILNVQAGGALAHRVGSLPLFVDGRLVELNIALFDQPGDERAANALPARHRRIVFSLTTPALGRVAVEATLADAHMRVQVSAEASDSAQFLAAHAGELTATLEGQGWSVDELAYRTTPPAAPGAVARSVLEHLVAPGSVSALA